MKRKILLIVCIIVSLILCVCLYFFLKSSTINSIKKHYYKNVVVTKNSNLYDKNKKKIGTVSKDFTFELENIKEIKTSNTYFKIKDSNYYVYNKDVKRVDKIISDELNSNYLELNKNFKTKRKTDFYKEGKKVLSINNGIELSLLYMDEKYYYVKYLNRILGVKKDKSIELNDVEKEDKEAKYISIVNYTKIDNCNEENCISIDKAKEQLNYLKENNFYTITINDYINWKNNYIRLKEGAILLTTNENNDNVNSLKDEYKVNIELIDDNTPLKFNNDNKTTNKESDINSLSRYVINTKTTIDKFKQITLGENVTYEVPKVEVQTSSGGQGIAVVNYHFFYDPTLNEGCNENICLDVKDFKEQLNYLKENNFKTLTMDEFRKWMYGEIELPKKSVLLTIDDGAFGTGKHNGNKLIPILEEYNMHATLFLITGWWDVENYRSKNLDIQSHTNDMHDYGTCGKGHVVCASHDELLADLQKSLQIVDNNNSFCFPFYSSSDLAVQTVKEAGFKLAFVGGNRKATRSSNKYLIPRYPIYKTTSLQQFINMVN